MIRKKPFFLALFFLAAASVSRADWKQDLKGYLGASKDYPGAMMYLERNLKDIDPGDRPTAVLILAYSAQKIQSREEVMKWIVEYFETYLGEDTAFEFLDDSTLRDFVAFLAAWKSSYPWVREVSILEPVDQGYLSLPAQLKVGIEVENKAYFKLSDRQGALGGGLWQSGFHILSIPLAGFFAESGSHEFYLDLKTDDFILRKVIYVDVKLASSSPAPSLLPRSQATPDSPRLSAGELSLYIDDILVASSKKLPASSPSLKFPIPPPSPPGTKPFMLPRRDNPFLNSASILDALGIAYKAIKELTAKKPPQPPAPTYSKKAQISLSFPSQDAAGSEVTMDAVVKIRPGAASVLEF